MSLMRKIMVILWLFVIFVSCRNQLELNEENYIFQTVIDILSEKHYLQKNLNDDFFDETIQNYYSFIDRSKVFLSKENMARLESYKNPNQAQSENRIKAFQETLGKIPQITHEIYQKKVPLYRKVALEILDSPIDFRKNNDFFENDADKKKFVSTDEQSLSQWKKSIKYDVLLRLLQATDSTNQQSKVIYDSKEYQTQEKIAREGTLKATKIFLLSLEAMKPRDFFNLYLRALGESYDQYTTYQSPVEEETFHIGISGELEGIGAQIGKAEDGSIEVANVIPGGPAFKQKALEAGDKILKAAQGEGVFVDLVPLTLNEGLTHIRGKKDTTVRLKVKRVSGQVEMVSIVRGKVVLAETYIQSSVIKTVRGKYGYILVPKFYGAAKGTSDRRVSEDMKNAIVYLKKQKVKGLIIDLRNNLGGFLGDAIRMTRYFIGEGPVVRVKSRWHEEALDDEGRNQLLFKKPVVIMINENSASASEIFSAALQDYNRAIVVGSGQSFGKATVQQLFSLARHSRLSGYNRSFGSLKFTIQKYYRVTGLSTQTKGVQSDIILPGLSINLKNKKHSFPIDQLRPMIFPKGAKGKYKIDQLTKSSQNRINQNSYFGNVKKRRALIDQHIEHTRYRLNYEEERKVRDYYLAQLDRYKLEKRKVSQYFMATPNLAEIERLNDVSKSEEQLEVENATREEWIKNLHKDIYLEETIFVLEDILG